MYLDNIDYEALREQKAILINMIQAWGEADDPDQQKDAQQAEGLLHLIDAVQDYAVDMKGMSEEEVFGFKSEHYISAEMVSKASQFLVADEYTVGEQLTAITKQAKIDASELIDNVDGVQVWEIVEFRFSCEAFLEYIS